MSDMKIRPAMKRAHEIVECEDWHNKPHRHLYDFANNLDDAHEKIVELTAELVAVKDRWSRWENMIDKYAPQVWDYADYAERQMEENRVSKQNTEGK